MVNRSAMSLMAITFTLLISISQFASASGLGWVLYGNITSASTCLPIAGAKIVSPYNNYAYNITNSNGEYRMILGSGNWSVTVSAAGYNNGSYLTPYYSTGAWEHNFSLVPVGGTARTTPCNGATVINVTQTTITPGVNTYQTTSIVQNTTSVLSASSSSGISGSEAAGIAIVVIIIIVIVAYFAMQGKKKPPEHHHTEEHHHTGEHTT